MTIACLSQDDLWPSRAQAAITGVPDWSSAPVSFPADYLLLDSGQGTGETFDWSLLKGMNRPFFLAGGLNPDNVIRAISDVHPYGVDVSSGVETDGRKDYDKMKAFIEMVRSKS